MFLSRGLLLKWENFQVTKLGPSLRSIGQRLIKMGATIQGEYYRDERRINL